MATIGKMQNFAREFSFEWKIDTFLSLSEKCYTCSQFSLAGESWFLSIYPHGRSETNSVGFIEVYLHRKLDGFPISLAWSLRVTTYEKKTYREIQFTYVFEKALGCGKKLLKRSELSEKKSELVPSGVLTLVCHIQYYSESSNDTATEKLVGDLADILESEEHSDVTIRVKGKEFRLHRSILAARNPYFNSMFKIEMKEKTTGIVSIDDCEPDIFQSFINFLYTGKVHKLSCDNVCALYEVADKYQEDLLKAECLFYMMKELSIDSFSDFIVLALKHDERELLQKATDLYCRKTKDIIQSAKWQTFMREYPTRANELYIKAVDYFSKQICKKWRTNCE